MHERAALAAKQGGTAEYFSILSRQVFTDLSVFLYTVSCAAAHACRCTQGKEVHAYEKYLNIYLGKRYLPQLAVAEIGDPLLIYMPLLI